MDNLNKCKENHQQYYNNINFSNNNNKMINKNYKVKVYQKKLFKLKIQMNKLNNQH